jgi:hypothetical protein
MIVLNFSAEAHTFGCPTHLRSGRIVLSTHLDRRVGVDGWLDLRGNEGVIVEIDS